MDDNGIHIEEGWSIIESRGFKPLASVLDVDGDYRRRHGVDGAKEWGVIYTTVYKMCIQKTPTTYAKELYERVQSMLKLYLRTSTLPALNAVRGKDAMLKELDRRWNNHKLMVKWVTRTFSYLDRYYVKRNDEPNLEKAGYMCFKKEIFDTMVFDVRKAALNIVRRERNGEAVDRSLLKQVLNMFVEMGMGKLDVYTQEWEEPFLDDTAEFYRRTSLKWAEEESFPDFMAKADACIQEEMDRAAQYLNSQTQERLSRVYEKEVLITHQDKMLAKENSGLVALLENNKKEDLQRLYKLYQRVPQGLPPIGNILKMHIQKEGMELVREQQARIDSSSKSASSSTPQASLSSAGNPKTPSSSDAAMSSSAMLDVATTSSSAITPTAPSSHSNPERPDFIQSLLALHDKYGELVTNCFGKHTVFNRAMKEAFERFVNEQVGQTSTAQLFANYCDSLLNSTGRGAKMSDADVETELDKLVKLFNYLSEKDVFQEFCRKQLAKRLLLDRSHSDDAERQLISKLKQSCGSHYTSKLEGMITDMNLSKDTQATFQDWVVAKSNPATKNDAVNQSTASGTGNAAAAAGADGGANAALTDKILVTGNTSTSPSSASGASAAGINGVDFTVRVLTTGHWPTYSEDTVVLPPQLAGCEGLFREYYQERTSQRVLRWVHSLGKGSLETSLFVGKKPYNKIELHVSTHQLCILMLFNATDAMTYGEILSAIKPKVNAQEKSTSAASNRDNDTTATQGMGTGVNNAAATPALNSTSNASGSTTMGGDDLIKASLVSLMSKKAPLLIKEPRGREFNATDSFRLNLKFVSPKRRLNIPMPTAKISEEEKEAAHETVVEDRRHAIEAAIVRVMKQYKTLEHQMLVMEVCKLCNPVFKPEPRAIKSRIEELITREYLARSETNNSSYEYLA